MLWFCGVVRLPQQGLPILLILEGAGLGVQQVQDEGVGEQVALGGEVPAVVGLDDPLVALGSKFRPKLRRYSHSSMPQRVRIRRSRYSRARSVGGMG